MPKTKKGSVEQEIIDALATAKLKPPRPKEGESRQDYLRRFIQAADQLKDRQWDELSETAQQWSQDAVNAVEKGRKIPELPDEDEEDEDMPATQTDTGTKKSNKAKVKAAKGKNKVADDEEDEDEAEEAESDEDEGDEDGDESEGDEDEESEESEDENGDDEDGESDDEDGDDEGEGEDEEDEEPAPKKSKKDKVAAKTSKGKDKGSDKKSKGKDKEGRKPFQARGEGEDDPRAMVVLMMHEDPTMKAPEIEKKLKKAGLELSPATISTVRYNARHVMKTLKKANLLKSYKG